MRVRCVLDVRVRLTMYSPSILKKIVEGKQINIQYFWLTHKIPVTGTSEEKENNCPI